MKKRSNRVLAWMLALGLALGLTACGGSSNYSANGVEAPGAAYDASESNWLADDDYGYYEVADTTEAEESAVSVAPSGSAEVSAALDSSKVKMIYTAHLNVEVLDLNQAVSGLNQMVAEMGGYFQSSDRSGSYGSYRYANYTVRIPADQYRAFIDAWSDSENCKLISAQEDSEDIGTRYFDIETRLNTLNNKMERLQTLMEQATEMEDIIDLENAISETEYEIELYTSDLNRYDSLINYSTVYITMNEVVKLAEPEEITFLQRLGQNFMWGLDNVVEFLQELVIWLAYNFVGVVIFAVVVIVIVILVRRSNKKRREQYQRLQAQAQAQAQAAAAQVNRNTAERK